MDFPSTGETLAPYAIGHFVGGGMRGSHQMPLMPVPMNTGVSYFDGPPIVSCAGFCVQLVWLGCGHAADRGEVSGITGRINTHDRL